MILKRLLFCIFLFIISYFSVFYSLCPSPFISFVLRCKFSIQFCVFPFSINASSHVCPFDELEKNAIYTFSCKFNMKKKNIAYKCINSSFFPQIFNIIYRYLFIFIYTYRVRQISCSIFEHHKLTPLRLVKLDIGPWQLYDKNKIKILEFQLR